MHTYQAIIKKVFKYIVSGGTAAVVDLVMLHILVKYADMWYLLAAIVAFLIAFSVSFSLQKFWTFQDRSTVKVKSQMTLYFCVSVVNLGVNTLLMYVFVDYFCIHYIVAQIIASGILAFSSYFIYSIFIFSKSEQVNNLQ
ncbi:MAG: GtrA family protein [Candidatus Pacebacteria bacterium]|jgi:dolichol-phosphate mannosyltransferase|nr:GtrA family protein [Candidatus Paceibacterota bacterium]